MRKNSHKTKPVLDILIFIGGYTEKNRFLLANYRSAPKQVSLHPITSSNIKEDYELTLKNLAESKKTEFEFFDNVIVNDEDKTIKKNRLELLSMLCKTFDNYIIFSNIETLK